MFSPSQNSASPKLHLSLSLDTAALSAAQISGVTEVLLINKLLNQCLGSLSVTFTTGTEQQSYTQNSSTCSPRSPRIFQKAKRRLPNGDVEQSPRSFKTRSNENGDFNPHLESKRNRDENSSDGSPTNLSNQDVQNLAEGRSNTNGNQSSESESTETVDHFHSSLIAPDLNEAPKVTFVDDATCKSSRPSLAERIKSLSEVSINDLKEQVALPGSSKVATKVKEEFDLSGGVDKMEFYNNSQSLQQANELGSMHSFPIPPMNFQNAQSFSPIFPRPTNMHSFPVPNQVMTHQPMMNNHMVPVQGVGLGFAPGATHMLGHMQPGFFPPKGGPEGVGGGGGKVDGVVASTSDSSVLMGGRQNRGRPSATTETDSAVQPNTTPAMGYSEEQSRSLFSCHLCSYKATRIELVRSHLRNYHSSLRPFKCILCSHSCKTRCNLISHYRGLHRMDIEEARRYAKSSHVMKYGPNVSAHFAGPAISMNRAYDSNISSASNPLASEAAAMSAQAMTAAIESSEQVVSALLAEDDTGESNSSQGS